MGTLRTYCESGHLKVNIMCVTLEQVNKPASEAFGLQVHTYVRVGPQHMLNTSYVIRFLGGTVDMDICVYVYTQMT